MGKTLVKTLETQLLYIYIRFRQTKKVHVIIVIVKSGSDDVTKETRVRTEGTLR